MKTRFNTFDILCSITELQKLVGMRVNNVYDIDSKTYLIRLQKSEEKSVLLIESGNRFHITAFEWPKNVAPSGFSMKLRKHLNNKRLEKVNQLGTDRIIDLQFGSGEAAYHIIVELYDRGNIALTDYEMTILYVLRPRTEGDKVKFAVKEKYPQDRAREFDAMSKEQLNEILKKYKPGDQLKKILVSNTEFGPPLIEHVLLKQGFSNSSKLSQSLSEEDIEKLYQGIKEAEAIFDNAKKEPSKGYIIQKREEKPSNEGAEKDYFYSNQEFHPFLFIQHSSRAFKEFATFNTAVDEFFSSLESQKLEMKALQQEREAMKKLENVRKDHGQRLVALEKTQEEDKKKAELITRNQVLVDQVILAIRTFLASQFSWSDIDDLVKQAKTKGESVLQVIQELKLNTNHISLRLNDPYADFNKGSSNIENGENIDSDDYIPSMVVDVDLDLTAFANARRYYDQKRSAAKKQQKTIESQSKAYKSAEKKTKQTLKEVQTITSIIKARKVYWFEKFFWFISSENYLVIAGRDQQQNELIVKRYMRPTDVYVHADIHGASSVVIKNPTGQSVSPKTLLEAGTMAVCYSAAWDAKVVSNAYWVWGEQVSKTAPTGEYLTTGSFMIRGKKNFLPESQLVLGLSFLFRVEDGCVEKHKGERKVQLPGEEDSSSVADKDEKDEVEIEIINESDEEQNEIEEVKNDDDNTEKDTCTDNKSNITEMTKDDEIKQEVEEVEEEDDSESESESKFPDTQIKIQHHQGAKMDIIKDSGFKISNKEDSEETVIYLGDDKPIFVKPSQRSRGPSESKSKNQKQSLTNKSSKDETSKQQVTKRGQKSKLKKIKEKYGDQDEEERKLRMEILKSSGLGKESKKNKKGRDNSSKFSKQSEMREKRPPQQRIQPTGDEDEEPVVQADVDMIDALTGIPHVEDELLFAVPVVAPYNTLTNYKFKIKLTPGTGRRGKAAKTAVAMFLKDKTITPREKDLLKAVKDEQLARNIPGKVKLSAPKLKALKK